VGPTRALNLRKQNLGQIFCGSVLKNRFRGPVFHEAGYDLFISALEFELKE
jgi:hypothetical protein